MNDNPFAKEVPKLIVDPHQDVSIVTSKNTIIVIPELYTVARAILNELALGQTIDDVEYAILNRGNML